MFFTSVSAAGDDKIEFIYVNREIDIYFQYVNILSLKYILHV